jgi:hypothetical protein
LPLSISKPIGGTMAYRFTTPTILEEMESDGHPLFSRIKIPKGITVLKIDGDYFEVRYPSAEEVADADIAYIGGYSYEVTAGEKADLESAGYTVETV